MIFLKILAEINRKRKSQNRRYRSKIMVTVAKPPSKPLYGVI
jgi:hypothetical protein